MKVIHHPGILLPKHNHFFSKKSFLRAVYFTVTLLYFTAGLCCHTNAQFYKPSAATVRMGETLPESFYQTVHQGVNARTGEGTTIELADYRDKLIILDFWANWCKPCIASLNKLDSMQQATNDDRYAIIPVTYQSPKEVDQVMKRLGWHLNSIVNDTTLAQVFPHGGIPHQVWVKDGKVLAFPRWHASMAADIQATLDGDHPYMLQHIQDLVLDPARPMFTEGNGKTGKWFRGKYAQISRYLPDYRTENLQYLLKGDSSILYCNNQPIEQLFYQAFKREIFPNLGWREGEGIRWEISDKLRERFFEHRPQLSATSTPKDDSLYLDWQRKNLFGYELRYPETLKEDEARYFMQQDLNEFFGTYLHLSAKIEPGPKLRYAVLRLLTDSAGATKLLRGGLESADGRQGEYQDTVIHNNLPFGQHFQMRLAQSLKAISSERFSTYQAVVDSTGLDPTMRCSFYFPKSMWGNLTKINRELGRYGMYIDIEEKNVPVLVIRENRAAKGQPYQLN